jgi:hypothetical protein
MKGNKRKVLAIQFSILASGQPNPGNKYIHQIYNIPHFLKHANGPWKVFGDIVQHVLTKN